jgi:transposase
VAASRLGRSPTGNTSNSLIIRQSEIYAREGVDLDRSTLADWVGAASYLLSPLVDQLRKHVLAASKLHADDTPVPVLAPGTGKTKTARLWTYVRDHRPAGSDVPPAVWFAYSEDRKGEHPKQHVSHFSGVLQPMAMLDSISLRRPQDRRSRLLGSCTT